jgi:hypothetical protein
MSQLDLFLEQIQEEDLEESKKTTMSRDTRQAKINRATGQLASVEARKKNDPAYRNMIKYREMYFKYRDQVHKKYSPRVRSRARR